ncbi:MAG: adenylate/guanylate cyclase domain-containing protein [Vicinamibacterales bacterium]
MATLRVQGPGGRAFDVPVRGGETSIGRDTANGLSLNDARVSRRHAILRQDGAGLTLTDLSSRNGTYHNGRRLGDAPVTLAPGDVIKIGDYTLVVDASSGSAEAAAADPMRAVLQKAPHELLVSGAIRPGGGPEASPEGLRHELEKKTRVLGLFYELSRTLGSVFSLPDVHQKAMALLLQVTPAARVVIYQRVDGGEMQQVAALTRGGAPSAGTPVTEPVRVSRTVFDDVTRRRVAVLLENTGAAAPLPESVALHQAHSVMAAPIIGRKGLLGLIYADQQDVSRAFSSDDLDLLNAVAVQTGIAIDTALAHEALQREAQAREKYERFLPQQLVDDVMLDPHKELKPGGRRQTLTVMFADLRGFTTLAEVQSPEVIVDVLNRFFTLMSEVIFRHGGTLDKYLGDGVMALFGAPYATERDAVKAVRAAIEMQRFVVTFNQELAAAQLPTIGLGIGINTGQAIVGFVGSDTRLDYTAIGDTVNTASRLEHLATAGQIIIGESTMQALDASVSYRPLDAVQVKGRAARLQIAEVNWAKR